MRPCSILELLYESISLVVYGILFAVSAAVDRGHTPSNLDNDFVWAILVPYTLVQDLRTRCLLLLTRASMLNLR